jgi:hypothetical protein
MVFMLVFKLKFQSEHTMHKNVFPYQIKPIIYAKNLIEMIETSNLCGLIYRQNPK